MEPTSIVIVLLGAVLMCLAGYPLARGGRDGTSMPAGLPRGLWTYHRTGGHPRSRRSLAAWLGGGLCLVLAAQFCPLRAGIVRGHSMAPTLSPDSLFLFDQTYYQRHPVRAGDIVLIRHAGGVWVKRVFASEGQSFWSLRERKPDGTLYRDPIAPQQRERFSEFAADRRSRYGTDLQVVRLRLPVGLLFLVGDGAWSEDSRKVGPLATADVIGRVIELPGQRLGAISPHIVLSFMRAPSRQASPPEG